MRCDWLLYCGSANEKSCCSNCCEVQKNCTRLPNVVLAARDVCTRRLGGGIYTLLWVTGRLTCTTALSFWVKLLALQFSHIHMCSPTSDLQRSTPLSMAETVGCSAMPSSYIYAPHFQALWSSNSENYISSTSKKQNIKKVLLSFKSFLFYLNNNIYI